MVRFQSSGGIRMTIDRTAERSQQREPDLIVREHRAGTAMPYPDLSFPDLSFPDRAPGDPAHADRRRPGRLERVTPALIGLLRRHPDADMCPADDRDASDALLAARGICIGGMVSTAHVDSSDALNEETAVLPTERPLPPPEPPLDPPPLPDPLLPQALCHSSLVNSAGVLSVSICHPRRLPSAENCPKRASQVHAPGWAEKSMLDPKFNVALAA